MRHINYIVLLGLRAVAENIAFRSERDHLPCPSAAFRPSPRWGRVEIEKGMGFILSSIISDTGWCLKNYPEKRLLWVLKMLLKPVLKHWCMGGYRYKFLNPVDGFSGFFFQKTCWGYRVK